MVCLPHTPACVDRHLLVHYTGTYNSARKARQLATSHDHSVLFHPSGSVVQCYSLLQGHTLGLLRGHFDSVNAVAYNPLLQVDTPLLLPCTTRSWLACACVACLCTS